MNELSLESLSVSTEAIKYDRFYHKHGVRKISELSSPRFSLMNHFELPQEAIVHYVPESSVELGISPSHFFLQNSDHVLTDHVTELSVKEGSPLKERVNEHSLTQKYRSQYRMIRPLKNIDTALRAKRSVIVINYSLLQHLTKYRKTFQARQFKFTNVLHTVVDKINEMAELTSRDQYVSLTLPKVLPERETFVRGAKGLNRATLNSFGDDQALMLLEIWMLLGASPENSILAKLSDNAKTKLNFVLGESGRFTVINVGQWLSWGQSDENRGGLTPQQMQIRFLQMLDSTFAIRSAGAKSTVETKVDDNGDTVPVNIVDEGEEIKALQQLEDKADAGELEDTQVQYTPARETDDYPDVPEDGSPNPFSPGVVGQADYLLDNGAISVAEHRRFERLAKQTAEIKNPYGDNRLLDEIANANMALEEVPVATARDSEFIQNKHLLNSTVGNFNSQYIDNVMHADMLSSVMAAQNAGIAVTGYDVEEKSDANGTYEIHSVKFTPVGGSPSTFRFRVPKVNSDGSFRVGGVNYRMRGQRGDIPIRKVNPFKVALTSYYSKLFVARSQKKKDNYENWLQSQVQLIAETKDTITNIEYGNSFNSGVKAPRAYSIISRLYHSFVIGDIQYLWDYKKVLDHFGIKVVVKAQGNQEYPCGYDRKDNKTILMSSTGVIYKPDTNEVYGTLEDILALDTDRVPNEVAEIDILGKTIPVGALLCYYFGLNNLLRTIGVQYRTVDRGARMQLEKDEFIVRFADKTLILSRQERLAQLIIAGLNHYKQHLDRYNMADFDDRDVYGAVFEAEGLGVRYVRELDLMNQMYIDPITEQVLKEMNEPTSFVPLLVRACELLLTDDHPDEIAGSQLRLKGYERFSGHIYQEMIRGIRQYKAKPLTSKAKVDIHPNAIWNAIQQDPSSMIIEESNPIHNLKEQENTTFSGTGGRTSRTMVRRTRQFHPDDMGVISESTVDNGDVAVTTFLTPNSQLKNLRGVIKPGEKDVNNISSMVSTSALVSPEALRDDAKRTNFISIQQSHVISAKGYRPSPLRTGYENVIAHRTGSLFSYTAKGDGLVTKVTDDVASFSYNDESLGIVNVAIGRRYGIAAGKTVPHDLVCDAKPQTLFKKGDVLVYNSGFFERDLFDQTQVTWKIGCIAKVALLESNDTIEDSCSISERLAGELESPKTQVREIILDSNQNVINLVNAGEVLDADSILCNVQDSISDHDTLDQETSETLRLLASNSPRAKYKGTVQRIEVLYNGDLEDMTESLRTIVSKYDKRRRKEAKELGVAVTNGQVDDMNLDTVMIRIYIDSFVSMGDGDKCVFSNQLKSVVKHVMVGENTTEDGQPIDAIFGSLSVDNRIVLSAEVMGTTNVLLRLASERMAKAYRNS